MNIGGFQRLSLLDYPDKTCCTIFTVGCNYRCPFCHNASIIQNQFPEKGILQEEVIDFLKRRKGLLDGVCITGGEPLLQESVGSFIEEIKSLGFLVKLDTNGSLPKKLKQLIETGLVDYVAMDIKNSPDSYGQTIGINNYNLDLIKESVDLLLSNIVPYEFRTTVVRQLHTSKDMLAIAQWLKGAEHYYLQNFVDSGDILESGLSGFSREEMQDFQELIRPIIPSVELRGI
ncbi:anaerobic ribonucleoside-triphosphate reductase activating protein [Acetobacterium malicum]|uniref:Anaerobic ribonucleoside-triphosphate reductase activating protein n=1 Tax=Acetobacterium malicum TaxID=52692 RepID=A0ABR6YU63_9FIRM|nr:anaerobic ribonucleoside-triphosphate reductase activating protein [Acetobacterium malicum]MBC3898722.1 anaerobic ribonucleoside-triphosphate reductase activating protein [Acetobacterium malicum]